MYKYKWEIGMCVCVCAVAYLEQKNEQTLHAVDDTNYWM